MTVNLLRCIVFELAAIAAATSGKSDVADTMMVIGAGFFVLHIVSGFFELKGKEGK